MTRTALASFVLATALLTPGPALAAVPQVLTYTGYLKTPAGVPVSASTNLTFRFYDAAAAGNTLYTKQLSVVPGSDGWFSVVLDTPPGFPSFSADLYIGITVESEPELAPRTRLTPSPSALAVDWGGVQGRPATCPAGQFLTLDAGGALACAASGGVASVGVSPPLVASGSAANPVIGLTGTCSAGQVLKWDGAAWGCAADAVGGAGGSVVSVGVVAPILNTGTATAPVISLPTSCATAQVLRWNGAAWACATETTGTVTSVATGTGLTGGPITTAGTVAIDPAVVPRLGVANTFAAANTFQAGLSAGADVDLGQNVLRRGAPAMGILSASFQGTVDTTQNAATITKGDGLLQLQILNAAPAVAEVRNFNSVVGWGSQVPGSFLAFKANVTVGAEGHSCRVTHGGAAGTGNQSGGYGFRIGIVAGFRILEGEIWGANGARPAGLTINNDFPVGTHSFFAIDRGATVEFFVDGVASGSLPTTNMGRQTFPAYSVRLDSTTTTGNSSCYVSFLTIGTPML
jgi:hypothetical protein